MNNFSQLVGHMGPAAIGVASALILMALAAMAVFLERLYTLSRSRAASRQFAVQARALLEERNHEGLLAHAERAKGHLAQLLGAGAKAYLRARAKPSPVSPVEATRRELDRKSEALASDVRRGFGVIASVGSIAPFVGLLGTVFGIITAFQGIAKEGSGGLGSVSLGISEALYETALGLVVAIPAVLAFNLISAQADKVLLGLDQARGEFVDYLESVEGTPKTSERPQAAHVA